MLRLDLYEVATASKRNQQVLYLNIQQNDVKNHDFPILFINYLFEFTPVLENLLVNLITKKIRVPKVYSLVKYF